jgi:hypothetical protein
LYLLYKISSITSIFLIRRKIPKCIARGLHKATTEATARHSVFPVAQAERADCQIILIASDMKYLDFSMHTGWTATPRVDSVAMEPLTGDGVHPPILVQIAREA